MISRFLQTLNKIKTRILYENTDPIRKHGPYMKTRTLYENTNLIRKHRPYMKTRTLFKIMGPIQNHGACLIFRQNTDSTQFFKKVRTSKKTFKTQVFYHQIEKGHPVLSETSSPQVCTSTENFVFVCCCIVLFVNRRE